MTTDRISERGALEMAYTSYQCPGCGTEVKIDPRHVCTVCPNCGTEMNFHRSVRKNGTIHLHIVVDTSASIRRPAALAAMQETLDKLCQLLPESIPEKLNILCYRCGKDEVKIFGDSWRPKLSDCGGIAPIDQVFSGELQQIFHARQRHMVIVLSDGYWCGDREVIASFEHDCLSCELALLAEINIENNEQWNFTHPDSLRLRNTDSTLIYRLSERMNQF